MNTEDVVKHGWMRKVSSNGVWAICDLLFVMSSMLVICLEMAPAILLVLQTGLALLHLLSQHLSLLMPAYIFSPHSTFKVLTVQALLSALVSIIFGVKVVPLCFPYPFYDLVLYFFIYCWHFTAKYADYGRLVLWRYILIGNDYNPSIEPQVHD
jgi:hypothetical protein